MVVRPLRMAQSRLWLHMLVTNLELFNFRNHKSLSVIFTSGMNVIVGANGVGKTNIVEAIDMLGFAKSFRSADVRPLIHHDAEKAIITAEVHNPARTTIELELAKGGKKISVNGKVLTKLSQLSKYVHVSTFQPEDVLFFDEGPSKRRRFLDTTLAKNDEIYLGALIRYEKLLKERNAVLKSGADAVQLAIIEKPFLEAAQIIIQKRIAFTKSLGFIVNEKLKVLSGERLSVAFRYSSTLGSGPNFVNDGGVRMQKNLERERVLHTTTMGPHRDDLTATLNGRGVKEHASQGQKRLIVIAIKIAPYFLEKEGHRKPIIILDDVLSELDENHQERLINLLLTLEQVFVTATEYKNHAHSIYKIEEGGAIRRTS